MEKETQCANHRAGHLGETGPPRGHYSTTYIAADISSSVPGTVYISSYSHSPHPCSPCKGPTAASLSVGISTNLLRFHLKLKQIESDLHNLVGSVVLLRRSRARTSACVP